MANGASDERRDNCLRGARNEGALTFGCSSISIGDGGMTLTVSLRQAGDIGKIIPPPSLVQDESAEFTEQTLKSDGVRDCAADDTEVVDALLSLAILEAWSLSSGRRKSAPRL